MTDYQLTENVNQIIKIEKGNITCAVVNQRTNKIYLAYPNFVLVVDCTTMNVEAKIEMPRVDYTHTNPQIELSINEVTNKIYGICDGKLLVIDGDTNKLDPILEDNHGAKYLAINSVSNSLYVSYPGTGVVRVFDCNIYSKIVDIEIKTPSGVAFDSIQNRIYVVNESPENNLHTISVIDGTSNEVIDSIVFPAPKGGVWEHLTKRATINEAKRLLYVVGITTATAGGGGTTYDTLFVWDIEKRQIVNRRQLGIDLSLAIDHSNNRIYQRRSIKNEIVELDEHANKILESEKILKMGFWKRIISARQEAIVFNNITRKLYVTDGRYGMLWVLDR